MEGLRRVIAASGVLFVACGASDHGSDAGVRDAAGQRDGGGSHDTGFDDEDVGPEPDGGMISGGCNSACVAAIEAKMVRIRGGTFRMGSPRTENGFDGPEYPTHRVTLTRDYWIERTEVTQAEFEAVRGRNPSHWIDCGGDCPVDQVSWENSVSYVNELSKLAGLETCYEGSAPDWTFKGLDCKGYRLPTEAEWEYAARGGSMTAVPTGDLTNLGCTDADPNADQVGWYCANSAMEAHPVAQKAPNAFGLYDMNGNAWEWVHDVFAAYPNEVLTDPLGPETGPTRVRRGGSYRDGTAAIRSSSRSRDPPDGRHYCIGFRIARTHTSTSG